MIYTGMYTTVSPPPRNTSFPISSMPEKSQIRGHRLGPTSTPLARHMPYILSRLGPSLPFAPSLSPNFGLLTHKSDPHDIEEGIMLYKQYSQFGSSCHIPGILLYCIIIDTRINSSFSSEKPPYRTETRTRELPRRSHAE